MRFFHLSDLHLGKRLHEYSLREDQADILEKILEAVRRERPDAVLLSGDLYDKTMPSAESVQLLNLFLEGGTLPGTCDLRQSRLAGAHGLR